jgi:hypothetical protein
MSSVPQQGTAGALSAHRSCSPLLCCARRSIAVLSMTNRHPSGRSVMFFVTLYAYRRVLWRSVHTGHNEGTKGRTECCKVVSNQACLLDQFSKLSHVVAAMQARGETNLVAAHAAPVRLFCMDNMSYRIGSSPHRISHRWKQMCCEFVLYIRYARCRMRYWATTHTKTIWKGQG